jgi:chromosome segregation ATPase
LGARISDPMAFSAPPGIPDPIAEAAKFFWESALASARSEASSALESDRVALNTAARKLEIERAEIQNELARVNVQLSSKEEAAVALRAHLAEAQQRIATLLTDLQTRDLVIDELRAENTTLEEAQLRVRQQFDADRSTFERTRQELEARESANATRWALEVDRAREATKAIQSRLAQLEKDRDNKLEALNARLEDSTRQARQVGEQQTKMVLEIQTLRHALEAEYESATQQRELHRTRESELMQRSERLEEQLSNVIEQLKIKENEHGSLLRLLIDKRGLETPADVANKTRRRKAKG